MPSQVRVVRVKNVSFDHLIQEIVDNGAYEKEHFYYGIGDLDRAMFVRQKIRTAGRHMDPPVAVKCFRVECKGCEPGGPDCRYHVSFTVYDMDKARAYMERKGNWASRKGQ